MIIFTTENRKLVPMELYQLQFGLAVTWSDIDDIA